MKIVLTLSLFLSGTAYSKINKTSIKSALDSLTTKTTAYGTPYRSAAIYVYRNGKTFFYSSGNKEIQENSFVEIASNTKVFTGLLLAQMLQSGEVSKDSTINQVLGDNTSAIDLNFIDLSTHRSGLPKLPNNKPSQEILQPYQGYTLNHLKEYLKNIQYRTKQPQNCKYDNKDIIGAELRNAKRCFNYSNTGVAVLGQVLAQKAQKSFREVLKERVLSPFSLSDTKFELSKKETRRFVQGYNWEDKESPKWIWDSMDPMGGLLSTPRDMINFLIANLNSKKEFIKLAQQKQSSLNGVNMGLGWFILGSDESVKAHSGGTYGFSTYMSIHSPSKSAVFLVLNGYKMSAKGIPDPRPPVFGEKILLNLPITTL